MDFRFFTQIKGRRTPSFQHPFSFHNSCDDVFGGIVSLWIKSCIYKHIKYYTLIYDFFLYSLIIILLFNNTSVDAQKDKRAKVEMIH